MYKCTPIRVRSVGSVTSWSTAETNRYTSHWPRIVCSGRKEWSSIQLHLKLAMRLIHFTPLMTLCTILSKRPVQMCYFWGQVCQVDACWLNRSRRSNLPSHGFLSLPQVIGGWTPMMNKTSSKIILVPGIPENPMKKPPQLWVKPPLYEFFVKLNPSYPRKTSETPRNFW